MDSKKKKSVTKKQQFKGIYHPDHLPGTIGMFGMLIAFSLFSLQLALFPFTVQKNSISQQYSTFAAACPLYALPECYEGTIVTVKDANGCDMPQCETRNGGNVPPGCEYVYSPKQCFTTPCPQYDLKCDGTEDPVMYSCQQSGGTWKLFNNGCVDSCTAQGTDVMCAQVMTWGCDCLGSCWDDASQGCTSFYQPAPAGLGEFCGGIAGIQCETGLRCQLDGTYPDAGGTCVLDRGIHSCEQSCLGDVDESGSVEINDLLAVLGEWGTTCDYFLTYSGCANCPVNMDDDPQIGILDLLVVLSQWGNECSDQTRCYPRCAPGFTANTQTCGCDLECSSDMDINLCGQAGGNPMCTGAIADYCSGMSPYEQNTDPACQVSCSCACPR